jgi:Glycosyl transferase family 2
VSAATGPAPPLVSVIIPAYQAARWIAEALDSVFAQTFQDYEVIVVNDGSPDTPQLEAVLQPYRGRIRYLRQENQGLAGARNTAIRAARARYVAFLDADDLWEPDFLAVQTARLEADPSIDVLYADARIFGDVPEAGKTVMQLCPSQGSVTFESLVTRQCTVHVCVTMARRASVVRAGLFDASLRRTEDFELWLRILHQGGRIAYHRQVLGRYRRRPGSLSADAVAMTESVMSVLAKAAQYPQVTAAQRQIIERQLAADAVTLELLKGKQAFAAGHAQEARRRLSRANAVYKSPKLAIVIILLRIAPGFLHALSRLRDRWMYRRRPAQR